LSTQLDHACPRATLLRESTGMGDLALPRGGSEFRCEQGRVDNTRAIPRRTTYAERNVSNRSCGCRVASWRGLAQTWCYSSSWRGRIHCPRSLARDGGAPRARAARGASLRDQLPASMLDHWPDDGSPNRRRVQPTARGSPRERNGFGASGGGGRRLIELALNGAKPVTLITGDQRSFVEDDDAVILRGGVRLRGIHADRIRRLRGKGSTPWSRMGLTARSLAGTLVGQADSAPATCPQ
jgi:hypothetical protein